MRARLQARIAASDGEAGLTIVEVLVASIVLVLGAAGTFGIFAAATKNAQRAKASQVALDLAQEELERLHSLPYENLALNVAPPTAANPRNPGYRVQGSQFALQRNGPSEYRTLVLDLENGVSPESDFYSGETEKSGIKGTLYRYVVWRNDDSCPEEQCPGEQDYKQIVVAVKPDRAVSQGGEGGYVEVQSELTDPESEESEPEPEPEPEPDEEGNTAQQFFLTDTPCAAGGTTERVTITADHLLHNTLGTCASGLKEGPSEPGAPDALLLSDPPDPDPLDESNPPLYDYSDDTYLEPTPDTDKGVQIRRDDTSDCHYDPTGVTNPESQVHRWVTDPMPFDFEMSGRVTLEFYTRTLNDSLYQGKLCVYLFERSEAGSPPEATDTFLSKKVDGTTYWAYGEGTGYWPRNSWTKVRLTMEFEEAPHTIDVDNRLGVGLSVDRGKTPPTAIPIVYDHPNYPTRIEVDTSTPIEGEGE